MEVIDKYCRRIVRSGDYYTFAKAQHMIEMCRFHFKKERKLIRALAMTSIHRGIHKTKLLLKDEDLLEYNLMLIELDKLGINPVRSLLSSSPPLDEISKHTGLTREDIEVLRVTD